MTVQKRADSIAIIGAGASGSVALDVFLKENSFSKVKLFERREKAGGVWILDEKIDEIPVVPGTTEAVNDPQLEIPSELKVVGQELVTKRSERARFIRTPSYDKIRTNVPEFFMTFSDKEKWPKLDHPEIDYFTSRDYVEQYIQEYIEPNVEYVQYNTTLERVDKDYSKENSPFVLSLRKSTAIDGQDVDIWWKEEFDAIVLATGHYHVPYIPKVKGLDSVTAKYPDRVKYAKQFRNDQFYKDKDIIVVGGSASGIDISNVLSRYAKTVFRSEHENPSRTQPPARATLKKVQIKPEIHEYILTDEGFDVIFNDGTISNNPDFIIYGTGYDYSYPFLRHLFPDFSSDGVYLPHNFQHTFHIQDPKISTLGVPIGALSFRAFEYQSILISRYLSGKISLPSKEDQYKWVHEREEILGKARAYHRIGANNVVQYLNDLTTLGGGVSKIGDNGRKFPVVTEEQLQDWQKERVIILERLHKLHPEVENTWELQSTEA